MEKPIKILKIITYIILSTILIGILVFMYFKIFNIETEEPKQIDKNCNIETKQYNGRKIFVITPIGKEKNNQKILYFHGGSYVAQATNQHWEFIERIVSDTGATVILPDYPLTPKYNYKDVFDMVYPLYNEIIKEVKTNDLIVMGDSAGGGLALALVEKLSVENIPIPYKTILISPWLDVRLTNPKIEEVQKKDKGLNKETLKLAGIAYAGEDGINNYLVNPIDGELSKLKNITIITGTNDILNPDVYILEERAKRVNTKIEVKEYQEAGHIWLINKNSSNELVEAAYSDLVNLLGGQD